MGAEPYFYFVDYQPDIDAALRELRRREFQAGRYNPVMPTLLHLLPIGPDSPAPGAQHSSIEEAVEAAMENGTRSILDLDHVSETPEYCAVTPLSDEYLARLYGTAQPTREMVEPDMEFLEDVERVHGVYIVLYKDGKPDELLFAGYSAD